MAETKDVVLLNTTVFVDSISKFAEELHPQISKISNARTVDISSPERIPLLDAYDVKMEEEEFNLLMFLFYYHSFSSPYPYTYSLNNEDEKSTILNALKDPTRCQQIDSYHRDKQALNFWKKIVMGIGLPTTILGTVGGLVALGFFLAITFSSFVLPFDLSLLWAPAVSLFGAGGLVLAIGLTMIHYKNQDLENIPKQIINSSTTYSQSVKNELTTKKPSVGPEEKIESSDIFHKITDPSMQAQPSKVNSTNTANPHK